MENPERFAADLPPCSCGANRWRGFGGLVGGGSTQQHYECASCNASARTFSCRGGNVLFINPTERVFSYTDRVLGAVWRIREAERVAAEQAHNENIHAVVDATLGITSAMRENLPEALEVRQFNERRELKAKYRFQLPPELAINPLPPKMFSELSHWDLEKLITYVWQPIEIDGSHWQCVNYAETEDLPLPPDPIRVKHDAYFKEVFAAVEAATGVTFQTEEIENEYDSRRTEIQPWYRCYAKGYLHAEFIIGPRKRVDSITVRQSEKLPAWLVLKIRELARVDGVTYEENGRYLYAGEKFKGNTAHHVLIHAWTKAKCIEYLTVLTEAVKEASK